MDTIIGGRSPGSSLASISGSICYSSKLWISKLLQPSRSYGNRSGCYAPELVAPQGMRIPSSSHFTTSFEQNQGIGSVQGHTDRSLVASEGVVGRPLGDVGRGTSEVACQTGPLKTAPLAQVSFEPPSALSSCLETIQRFARARGVPSDVA